MLQVTLPDGSVREYSSAVTPLDVAAEISEGLARASVAAEIDGTIVGLHTQLPAEGGVALRILTKRDAEALGVMRHSCAHIMARGGRGRRRVCGNGVEDVHHAAHERVL